MALIDCPECGRKISDKSRICIFCGYPLIENLENSTEYCPYCGKENENESEFCAYCGKALKLCKDGNIQHYDIDDLIDIATGGNKRDANLHEKQMQISNENNIAKCPKCSSTSLQAIKKGFAVGKAAAGAIAVGPAGAIAGGIGSNKTIIVCLKCGYKYEI